MITLGVVLLLAGFIAHVYILWVLGIILLVVGAVVWLLGAARTGGRRWY